MANCLFLHDNYIIKSDFMNYVFAKLVVACLYIDYMQEMITHGQFQSRWDKTVGLYPLQITSGIGFHRNKELYDPLG